MNISVVIPLLNEQESLTELHDWLAKVMQSNHFSYEIIFIDDGSTDNSWQIIELLSRKDPNVKGIQFIKNYGKSQALHIGFKKAKGDVIITMDADLQDNPEEIPELYKMIVDENYDLVSGWKKKRFDSKITGVKLHDFNCGLKALKKDLVKNIDVHGEMHRYIPVLAKNEGFVKIGEKIVLHQARKYGKTKFGMERFIYGFLDLVTISFISKFGKRPMHFFGALGVIMFTIGFGFALYIGIDKLFVNPLGRLITERPQFYISLVTMIIGTQFFVAGFLGEIILRTQHDKKRYSIDKELNF